MRDKLLILPFDHRSSFSRDILGLPSRKVNSNQRKKILHLKEIIFEAFLVVYNKSRTKDNLAILVDEEYGDRILSRAKKLGIKRCLPVEKSGVSEFKFDYLFWKRHIRKYCPDYVKVLVRYNPLNKDINKRQLVRLEKLSRFCQKNNYRLMLELLVPATEKDLKLAGSKRKYDAVLRAKRTVVAIKQLRKRVKASVWKLEGFNKSNWKKVIGVVSNDASIIVLGRGEDEVMVQKWLTTAAEFEQIVGFAVGRTNFLLALKDYVSGKISRQEAIDTIVNNYQSFINLWNRQK